MEIEAVSPMIAFLFMGKAIEWKQHQNFFWCCHQCLINAFLFMGKAIEWKLHCDTLTRSLNNKSFLFMGKAIEWKA